jgi:peroxiredoxin
MQLLMGSFTLRAFAKLAGSITFAAMMVGSIAVQAATPPKVGDDAPVFTLNKLDGSPVEFAQVAKGRTAVLVVLRGWPGYQCPFCTAQVYEYLEHAADFAARKITVVMIYPGPADALQAHARDFINKQQWPQNFHYVIDPDYSFTKRNGLRWDEKGETAYPSTFVISPKGKIIFAYISHEHGDRVGAAALLRMLDGLK